MKICPVSEDMAIRLPSGLCETGGKLIAERGNWEKGPTYAQYIPNLFFPEDSVDNRSPKLLGCAE